MRRRTTLAACSLVITLLATVPGMAEDRLARGEVKAIAEEVIVYGFPMVMNYGVIYEAFIDTTSSQYKCPINQLYNTARVFTPKDTAVVTPNSDTPYSFFCDDLRSEPVVFTVSEVEKGRYYSVQLVDFYTCNYGYVGSRSTGNSRRHLHDRWPILERRKAERH